MGRNVVLTRSAISHEEQPNHGEVFRITIRVESANLMPSKIFLFKRGLIDPYSQDYPREFVCVVDPYEASVYPEDVPIDGVFPGYFRDDVVDLSYPQLASAEQIWEELQSDVAELVAAYNRFDELQVVETELVD